MTDIYINKHVTCGKALEEYNSGLKLLDDTAELKVFQLEWLSKYNELFHKCINKPTGLPWIHLSYSNRYYNIKDFANLYDEVYSKQKLIKLFPLI